MTSQPIRQSDRTGDPTPEAPSGSDWLLLIAPGVIWGASFLFIAEGLVAVAPYGLTFVRIVLGFLTLACVSKARKALPRAAWFRIAILGITWFAFPLTMFPFAEQRVSSALTGMLNGAVPLFTAVVASIVAKKLPRGMVLVGLATGLIGAIVTAWPASSSGSSQLDGILLILVALISYGIAVNVAIPLQAQYGALPVIWRAQAVALVLTFPLGFPEFLEAQWTVTSALSLLALGSLGTAVAMVIMTMSAGRFGATRASATTYLIPPVSLLLGVVVRGEHVALVSVIGAAICVSGAWLMQRSRIKASLTRA